MPITNPVGLVFGRLTVTGIIGPSNSGHILWNCRCSCGSEVVKVSNHVRTGHTFSCGCARREMVTEKNRTHGMAGSRTHHSWKAMLTRCRNHNFPGFYKHGGRGIEVCDRWLKFENFLSDMGERPEGMTLDRIDNNGDYEPGNCRWATPEEQNLNTRQNHRLSFGGESLTISEWSKRFGFKRGVLESRIRRGWSVDRALTESIR